MQDEKRVLVLCSADKDRFMREGLQCPISGPVEAPHYEHDDTPGNGLWGLLWGAGDSGFLRLDAEATYMVISVLKAEVLHLSGRVKFRRGDVVFSKTGGAARFEAADFIMASLGEGVRRSVTFSRAEASAGGYARTGDYGMSVTGAHGDSMAGKYGKSYSGPWGTARSGNRGLSVSGEGGVAESGDGGTSRVGPGGSATVGICGRAAAGEGGVIVISWFDSTTARYPQAVGSIGRDGLEPDTLYRVNEKGQFEKATSRSLPSFDPPAEHARRAQTPA